MGIFFTNPILGRIEDIMWDVAKEEIKTRLGDGANIESKEFTREAKKHFKAIFSEERKNAKMALKLYKQIAPKKTRQALEMTLSASSPDWYSIESSWSSTGIPELLAVPERVLFDHVVLILDALLSERIEFQNLRNRARSAFAAEAVEKFLGGQIKKCINDKSKLVAKSFYPYDLILVDVIRDDYYLLGEDTATSRANMIIISTTATKDIWEKVKKDLDARPQDRRFSEAARSKWSRIG